MASFLGYLYLLLVLVAVLLQADVVMAAENVNSTGFDVLEDVSNHINFEFMETIRKSDVYRVYFWGRYMSSSRLQRTRHLKEMSQKLARLAYVDNAIETVGVMLFGPEKSRSILRSVEERELSLMDISQCPKSSLNLFTKHCGFLSKHGLKHMQSFENMCNHVVDKAAIEEAFIASCGMENIGPSVIDIQNPVVDVTPKPMRDSSDYCDRVSINGISRTKIQSYAKAYQVMLNPAAVIPDEWHTRIQICFHRNASLGLCQCEEDDWRPTTKRLWSPHMSPYDKNFVDVKFTTGVSGYVIVTLDEVLQGWRCLYLVGGFIFLIIAPFAGIEFSGGVDGLAKFIRWTFRVIAVTCIFQSSIDTPLATVAVVSCFAVVKVYFVIVSILWSDDQSPELSKKTKLVKGQGSVNASGANRLLGRQVDFYSMYHKIPNRKTFSEEEWKEFTKESTRDSVANLISSSEFKDWCIKNVGKGSDADKKDDDDDNGSEIDDGCCSRFMSW